MMKWWTGRKCLFSATFEKKVPWLSCSQSGNRSASGLPVHAAAGGCQPSVKSQLRGPALCSTTWGCGIWNIKQEQGKKSRVRVSPLCTLNTGSCLLVPHIWHRCGAFLLLFRLDFHHTVSVTVFFPSHVTQSGSVTCTCMQEKSALIWKLAHQIQTSFICRNKWDMDQISANNSVV